MAKMSGNSFLSARKCHRCASDMGGLQWLCSSCRAQNRIFTTLQMIVSIVLVLVVLFFMGER